MKKTLLSGIKPTGRPHIGNYFGAMAQWIELQSQFNCHFMIADYHALNLIQDKEEMKSNINNLVLDYLAIGLDPEKSVIFKQSDIYAHTELTWIFDSIIDIPYLARGHAFKAEVEKMNDATPSQRSLSSKMEQLTGVSVGLFNYPVLMAADILLYDADIVPVGQDQRQHVEYTRGIGQKFNSIFGDTFKLPDSYIMDAVAVVPGTDGKKMSKSYGNTIPLFASREEITKAVMSIVTDSGSDIPVNVYNIHKLVRSEEDLKGIYDENKGKYKILKEKLIEDLDAFIKPLREKREELSKNSNIIKEVLEKGALRAKEKADAKLLTIKKNIGVL